MESPVHARAPLRNQGHTWRNHTQFRQSWLPFSVQVLLIFHVVHVSYATRLIYILCRFNIMLIFLFSFSIQNLFFMMLLLHWTSISSVYFHVKFAYIFHFICRICFVIPKKETLRCIPNGTINNRSINMTYFLFAILWTTCNFLCANTQLKLKLWFSRHSLLIN